jgi:hypothetical protein
MSEVVPPGHPYWNIRAIAKRYASEIRSFYFSYYEYVPQSLVDRRETFLVSPTQLQDEFAIEQILRNAPRGTEVAFHSTIDVLSGETKHLPMVDMSTGSSAQLAKLRPFLGEELFETFRWYRSGRSFHGYGARLATASEWTTLMGLLLLANQRGLPPTVDPRWVGHRLIAGYSALRWTKNTPHYITLPEEIPYLHTE